MWKSGDLASQTNRRKQLTWKQLSKPNLQKIFNGQTYLFEHFLNGQYVKKGNYTMYKKQIYHRMSKTNVTKTDYIVNIQHI